MKKIRQRFNPFTAIVIMITIVVIFIAADIILSALDSGNTKFLIEQVNITTENTNKLADRIADVVVSANRTQSILNELKQTQQLINQSDVEQQELLLPAFFELTNLSGGIKTMINQTDFLFQLQQSAKSDRNVILEKLDNITKIITEPTN